MKEGLKADEKKVAPNSKMASIPDWEWRCIKMSRFAQPKELKSVLAFCPGRIRLICAAALPRNAKRCVGCADQAGNVVANAQA